jgi:carbonic anhydrase
MAFACKLSGAKVVLVLGRTSCGAVAGARFGNPTSLLAKIRPAVAATRFTGDRSASNMAFVDAVARTHVGMTITTIRKSSPVLAGLERERKIKIAGAMYDLSTGAVEFMA